MATYSLKLSIENCCQTAADKDIYYWQAIDVASALSDATIAEPLRLTV